MVDHLRRTQVLQATEITLSVSELVEHAYNRLALLKVHGLRMYHKGAARRPGLPGTGA
jgi:hypothetical protein